MVKSQIINNLEKAWNKSVSTLDTLSNPNIQRGEIIKVNQSVNQGMIQLKAGRLYVCWRDFNDNPNNAIFVLVARNGEKMLNPWSGNNQSGLSSKNYETLMDEGYIEKSFAVLQDTPEYKI